PAACFVKYLNVPREHVPPITVHDEAPGTWHIVIPARPAAAGELSDEELEKVAGGTDISVTVVTMLSVAAGLSMIFAPAASMAVSVTIARGVSTGWNSK
ncbi:MAG: nitrile hydratase, partial [Vicinamibacterales bacterium]